MTDDLKKTFTSWLLVDGYVCLVFRTLESRISSWLFICYYSKVGCLCVLSLQDLLLILVIGFVEVYGREGFGMSAACKSITVGEPVMTYSLIYVAYIGDFVGFLLEAVVVIVIYRRELPPPSTFLTCLFFSMHTHHNHSYFMHTTLVPF